MPKVKQISIRAIFEKATGRKIAEDYLHRKKPPIALGISKPIAGNLQDK